MADTEQTYSGFSGSDVLSMLRRRKWLLIIPLIAVFGGAVMLAMLLPPQFQASATVEAVDRQLLDKFFQQVDFNLPHKPYLTTITEVIRSPIFLRDVIEKVGITEGFDAQNPKERQRLMQRVLDNTVVKLHEQKVGPDLLEIGYHGRDAKKVISFVNVVTQKYKDYVLEIYRGEVARARSSIIKRREAAKVTADAALGAFESFQKNNDFQLIGENVLTSRLTELARQREQLANEEVTEQGLQEKLERLRSSVSTTPTETVKRTQKRNPEYESQRSAVQDAVAALDSLKKRGTEKHPDYKKLLALVETAKARLDALPEMVDVERTSDPSQKFDDLDVRRTDVEAELQATQARIARLRASIVSIEAVTKTIPGLNKQAWHLKNARDDTADNLSRLNSTLASANGLWDRINAEAGDFFRDLRMPVVEEAESLDPIFPNVPLFSAVGAFVGLLLGGALVFLSEFASASFSSTSEIQRSLSVPVLANIVGLESAAERGRSGRRRRTLVTLTLIVLGIVLLVHVCFFTKSMHALLPPSLTDLLARLYGVR